MGYRYLDGGSNSVGAIQEFAEIYLLPTVEVSSPQRLSTVAEVGTAGRQMVLS